MDKQIVMNCSEARAYIRCASEQIGKAQHYAGRFIPEEMAEKLHEATMLLHRLERLFAEQIAKEV